MKLYRPTEPPPPRSLVWDRDARYMVESDRRIWNDYELRRGMEQALRLEMATICDITALLAVYQLSPLHAVQVSYPFKIPPTPYPSGGLLKSREIENGRLKEFAFDAQDALDGYFGGVRWQNWFVAPFIDCVGAESTFNVGVFVDEKFITEVVE